MIIAKCKLCEKEIIKRNRAIYCGSDRKKTGCSWVKRKERIKKWQQKNKNLINKRRKSWPSMTSRKLNYHNDYRLWGWGKLRKKILERDNYTCQICGIEKDYSFFDIDHKNSDRNDNNLLNLWTLCPNCHRIKTIQDRKTYKI